MQNPHMNDPHGGQMRMPVMDDRSQPVPPVGSPGASYPAEPYASGGYESYPPQGTYMPPQGQNPYQQTYPQQPYQTGPQQWTGAPAMPPMADPFGETGVDLRLREERSEHLHDRKDPFWDAPGQVQRKNRKDKQVEQRKRGYAGSYAAQRIVLTVMILVAICGVLYGAVFRVRTVHVDGNVYIPDEEIIRLAGVEYGGSILSVDEQVAMRGVNNNHYLIFDGMDKLYPSTVVITVRERTPAAVMNYCGINYVIDNKGMVLEETEDIDAYPGLPEVSGMDIVGAYGATVGRKLNVNSSIQLEAMSNILIELRVLSAEAEVTMVKMSNLSQLLLETREGYAINLGGYERIHEKLKAMIFIKDYLNGQGSQPGTIDVSEPTAPTFIPE
ncbi:MAG: FtsQ-type POTRA domain-containing protein [Clostridia bacterium]|nr:FtsQ-type POTRA domain-containing protein [Clostridia bacterium]